MGRSLATERDEARLLLQGDKPQSTLLSGTRGHRGPHRHRTPFTQTGRQGRLQRHSALGEQPPEAEGGDGPDGAGPGLLLGDALC